MEKFFYLKVTTEDGFVVVEHVSNYSDDKVYIEDAAEYGLPQTEWRKAHHLGTWIAENKPDWAVIWEDVAYESLSKLLSSVKTYLVVEINTNNNEVTSNSTYVCDEHRVDKFMKTKLRPQLVNHTVSEVSAPNTWTITFRTCTRIS